ncbi:hypothetical protein [Rufibacter psychrotolerans]|uniref:hypothetical protein n=1 Tax=Rufibacter psychrotolerans TaxID=2812556 RepID=UPI0019687298|nr:hypothetical protein [Rufibacter sp. SYSU D00308]
MVLFENFLVKLEYNPVADIMEVAYPDLDAHLLPEIRHSMEILVDHVASYDVKNLLLDSSHSAVSVGEEESKEISASLTAGLARTRLQKLARVQAGSPAVEAAAEKNLQVAQTALLPFELRNFSNKQDALTWLGSNP